MNAKHWAVFFVAILSGHHASATFFGHFKGVGRGYDDDDSGYYGWSKGCSCRGKLTSRLDRALNGIKSNIGRSYDLMPESLEEYELKDGRCSGLHKFERKGPYRCSVTRDYARIIFRIGFFNLLMHYKLSILDDMVSSFFGGFASIIFRWFGRITDYAFRVGLPDFYVTVVLRQQFRGNGGLYLEGFYPASIQKVNFLNDDFSRHSKSLSPYLIPVFDHVLRIFFDSKLKSVFSSSFESVRADRGMFSYKNGGRYNYWSGYNGGSDSEGDGDVESSSSGGERYGQGNRDVKSSSSGGERYGQGDRDVKSSSSGGERYGEGDRDVKSSSSSGEWEDDSSSGSYSRTSEYTYTYGGSEEGEEGSEED